LHEQADVETPASEAFEDGGQDSAEIENEKLAEVSYKFVSSAENVKNDALNVINIDFTVVQAGLRLGHFSLPFFLEFFRSLDLLLGLFLLENVLTVLHATPFVFLEEFLVEGLV